MKFSTSLISGAGNTFHILWKSPVTDTENQKKIVQHICQKIPADGFIFLNSDHNNYVWNFYNNDGSVAEMCGNATRCVGFFVKNKLNSTQSPILNLQTAAGLIKIETIESNKYKVHMTPIIELQSASHFFCDTGVPHIVIDFPDFDHYKKHLDFCKKLRFDPEFQPRGTNVTLIAKTGDPKSMRAVSYERGVENFTESCGTGAMAAAFYNYKKHGQVITSVDMPGGQLIMNLENINGPTMTGNATLIGDYTHDE